MLGPIVTYRMKSLLAGTELDCELETPMQRYYIYRYNYDIGIKLHINNWYFHAFTREFIDIIRDAWPWLMSWLMLGKKPEKKKIPN